MEMKTIFKNIVVFFALHNISRICGIKQCDISGANENRMYMVTEQPTIIFYDRKYFRSINFTTTRYGRHDPMYYVNLHFDSINIFGNFTIDFYIYELLTNVYKRSFVEMHFTFCDLIEKDKFFGIAMKQGPIYNQKCPYAPGIYHFYNMTVPVTSIPSSFPFTKGRIYANFSSEDGEKLGSGYINMELKPCKRTRIRGKIGRH